MTRTTTLSRRLTSAHAALTLCAFAIGALATTTAEAAPKRWSLLELTTNTGVTINGSFTYDAATGTYSDIDISADGPSGTHRFRTLNIAIPSDAGALRVIEQESHDLTGQPILLLDFAEPLSDAGGLIDLHPAPSGVSYQARCQNSQCYSIEAPFDDIASGQATTAQVWHLEGVMTASGYSLTGTYAYDAATNQFVAYQITQSDGGTDIIFDEANPILSGNSAYFSAVETVQPDMFGVPVLFMELAAPMTQSGGAIDVLPTPEGTSFISICFSFNCATVAFSGEVLLAGSRVTTSIMPPEITSPASVIVDENQTFAIDVDATDDNDSEGAGLTFALTGGADQALFAIDVATGVVTFLTAPSAAAPTDANVDNVYEVQVTVTDRGGRTAVTDVFIEVLGTPDIAVTSGGLNFGDVPLFGMPIDIEIHLANVGTGPLNVTSMTVEGRDDFVFEVVDATLCLGSLAPQIGCTALVRYLPFDSTIPGPLQAQLIVNSSDPDQPALTIPIAATAVLGTVQVPDSIDLGQVPVGATASALLPVTVSGPSQITLISLDDPDNLFTTTTNCEINTVVTTSCAIQVSYSPQETGGRFAVLLFESSDPSQSLVEVMVTAEGIAPVDTDNDGVLDYNDNCTLVANPAQRDTNGDGFGNLCDPDLNGDNVVNVIDLGMLRSVFFSDDIDADFNGDGVVNVVDLGIMRSYFFAAPGPAGLL